jgi:UDP-N-acetylglucosamine--N-acetylmuramyl-(pentapeptide) pyrophosphoryl-undecaprenol N-acetylglucosamine transferase
MKLLFVCGGTAGHINPALAVADLMRQRHPNCEILFVGNPKGMESSLIPAAGYAFAPIAVAGFQRRLSVENVGRNLKAAYLLALSGRRAKAILRRFNPDLVMGTGGYVTGPVVRQAAKMGIPTVTHEQNAFPGVTTKLLAPQVDRVLLAFEEAAPRLRCKNPPIVTGNPVRGQLLSADRQAARQRLGVPPDKLCILSFGGSLGAEPVNAAVAAFMLHHRGKYHHIHATGRQNHPAFTAFPGIAALPAGAGIDIRPYIEDMADCLAAADLVICRAGAITLSELTAVGRASILIPSPYVAENHQYHNAMALVNAGAADILEEKDLTGESLIARAEAMLENPETLADIGRRAAALGLPDAAERIAKELENLL